MKKDCKPSEKTKKKGVAKKLVKAGKKLPKVKIKDARVRA